MRFMFYSVYVYHLLELGQSLVPCASLVSRAYSRTKQVLSKRLLKGLTFVPLEVNSFLWGGLCCLLLQALLLRLCARATLQLGMGFSLQWLFFHSMGSRAHALQQLQHMDSLVLAPELQSTGLIVVVHRLSCSKTCGTFLDQGSNSFLSLALAGGYFTTEPLRRSQE